MLKYLKYQLLAFLVIVFIIFSSIVVIINLNIQEKNNAINYYKIKIIEVKDYLYKTYNNTSLLLSQKFNSFEKNPYDNIIINENKEILKKIEANINDISRIFAKNHKSKKIDNIKKNFIEINYSLKRYSLLYDTLIYFLAKRGNSDYGLIGELFDCSKKISSLPDIDRYTKKVLLDFEHQYFNEKNTFNKDTFYKVSNELIEKQKNNSSLEIISNYINIFKNIIEIEDKLGIGLSSQYNIIKELEKYYLNVEKNISLVLQLAEKYKQTQKASFTKSLFLIILIFVFVCYLTSLFVTKYIIRNLKDLLKFFNKIKKYDLSSIVNYEFKNSPGEIAEIFYELRNYISLLMYRTKQKEKALRIAEEKEKRYKELVDFLPQSVFEVDNLGNFTYVNKTWYKNFLYTPEDLKEGINIIETLVTEKENTIHNHDYTNYIAIRKDGSIFPASVYTDLIVKDGEVIGKRGIIIDMTERNKYLKILQEEMKRAKNADRLKSSFLANMSHEIRTPMNAIIGFSNLLIKEDLSEEQKKEFIYYIKSSGELLLNLIDDIIDFAKIEAGQLKIYKKDCNLNELLEEVKNTIFNLKIQNKKDDIEILLTKFPEDVIIKTDPFRLKQILNNLLINALKYTQKGYIKFGVRENNRELEFFVSDTGVGLTREELDKIFNLFERTKFSEEKNIKGTGLGLTISKNLVELMGGAMWVDSKPNEGTTFYFSLPFIRSTCYNPTKTQSNDIYSNFYWPNKTILIVEDDKATIYYYDELFKNTGAKLLFTNKGNEVLSLIQNNKIDIVLLDIQLPDISGLELVKLIKEISSIPVIAQTAYAMSGDREKCLAAGCDDYVSKPIDSFLLLNKISVLIESHEPNKNNNIYTKNTTPSLKLDDYYSNSNI